MILFDSLEGCDSNALILPDKKRNKKKGMDKVYTTSWLIFYLHFLNSRVGFIESLQLRLYRNLKWLN
jgi:hypothetical protein